MLSERFSCIYASLYDSGTTRVDISNAFNMQVALAIHINSKVLVNSITILSSTSGNLLLTVFDSLSKA